MGVDKSLLNTKEKFWVQRHQDGTGAVPPNLRGQKVAKKMPAKSRAKSEMDALNHSHQKEKKNQNKWMFRGKERMRRECLSFTKCKEMSSEIKQ